MPIEFWLEYKPLLALKAVIKSAIIPPAKCNKCNKVSTYKNEPEALLPGPVKYTPSSYNAPQVRYCDKANPKPNIIVQLSPF